MYPIMLKIKSDTILAVIIITQSFMVVFEKLLHTNA